VAPGSARANAPPPAPAAEVRRILHTSRVQPKLTVSAPDDAFEREADDVADRVMRMPESAAAAGSAPPHVQRMCTECVDEEKVHRAVNVNVPTPQTTTRDEDDQVRRKESPQVSDTNDGLNDAATAAVASSGSGRPLSDATRQFFERRFNADFGGVRIHDGPSAQHSAQSINARAFTYGSDIWLGSGERESNRSLLAHELVHVTQQGHAPGLLTVRRYVRTRTAYLWDIYGAAGRVANAVTDAQLRTTIEYEDYIRADLRWRFIDMMAIAALRRSMDLFAAGVLGREENFMRAGRETLTAAHRISAIVLTQLGFTGDHMITSVPTGLGGPTGALIDSPDGSSPVWSIGGTRRLVAYTLGTAPTMFARFVVMPPPSAPVPNVRVRAVVDGITVGQASGLQISGGAVESAPGSGKVTGIGGGAPIPSSHVGSVEPNIRLEMSTDGGRIWFFSGSARVRMIFTAAAPMQPGAALREDVLDHGGAVIGSATTAAAHLRELVRDKVVYDPSEEMPYLFTKGDAVMQAFVVPHQCDSQAYLLRYLALSFGIPATVVYVWFGTATEMWRYKQGSWHGPTFRCQRPIENDADVNPHFTFHSLTLIGGKFHDPSYGVEKMPVILEHAPGASEQIRSRTDFLARSDKYIPWTCPH
jgi:hypothetical protein